MNSSDTDYTLVEIANGPLLILDEEHPFDAGGMADMTRWERAICMALMLGASLVMVMCLFLVWQWAGV